MSTNGTRVALYSCYFGDVEPFNPGALGPGSEDGVDRFVFTDCPDLSEADLNGAILRTLPEGPHDPKVLSRIPKLCPHKVLPRDYDWYIYVDNRARLNRSVASALELIKGQFADAPVGRYFFAHQAPRDAYRELRIAYRKGFITEAEYLATRELFETNGFPKGQPLFVNTCMIQRGTDAALDAFNDTWLALFTDVCGRDQPILPYALHATGYPARVLACGLADIVDWPVFNFKQRRNWRQAKAKAAAQGA
ncbi:MAG: hypothetical protein AAF092_14075 [Pseudomonadota bacterium]